MPTLLTAEELVALRETTPSVTVLDVRWRLDRPDGRPDYLAGHIPGAVWVDLDSELASHGAPEEGRHPLPSLETLQTAARRWGLDDGATVIVYDDWDSLAAARAWWLLRGSGVADVRVLDGGLSAWRDAGFALETDDVVPRTGGITLTAMSGGVLSTSAATRWIATGVLLDARAPERYRGEVEPLDPVAGHIPGAHNLPAAAVVESGRFRDPDALRQVFAAVGATPDVPVAAYCGSGITAAHTALAGAIAGIEVSVYPGSWSAWSNTPGLPVATGTDPGAPA